MKTLISGLALLLCLVLCVFATEPLQRQVVVSYPKGTSRAIMEEAIQAIEKAGGVITHKYNLIVAFAAKVPPKVLEEVQTLGAGYNVEIEEDQVISINSP